MDCSRKSGPAFELGLAPLRGAKRWLKETSPGSRDRRTTTDAIDRALMMLCRAGHSGADARTDGLGHVGAPVTAEGRGGAISASDNGKAGVMIDACLCGQGGCVRSSKRKLRQFRVSPRSAHLDTAPSRPYRACRSEWAIFLTDTPRISPAPLTSTQHRHDHIARVGQGAAIAFTDTSRGSPTPTVSQSRQGARVDQVGRCGANA